MCGSLRRENAGADVRLAGWIHRSRNLGGLIFLDVRDRAGIVQVSINPASVSAETAASAASFGAETVVAIEGKVVERPGEMRNADMATGDVEVAATSIRLLSPAQTPAIPVARGKGEKLAAEELRLRHRYLDLRRPELQENLILRHRLQQTTRRFLDERGFLEIETPILTKPTPEGARDYLVPSRVHPGEFYALPQSPQIYKQLLMVAGYDRYFQIARCFRDEDLRADRQPEFTQIDIEASFIGQEDIFSLTEGLLSALFAETGVTLPSAFPRLTYADAMERFGTDRPDMRYALEIEDFTRAFDGVEFSIVRNAVAAGNRVRGIRVAGGAAWSRKQVDDIEAIAKTAGVAGLLRMRNNAGAIEGPAAKFLTDAARSALAIPDGELLLLVAAPDSVANVALDRVRQEVASRQSLASGTSILWVTDFPMFIRDGDALTSVHHPFTSPNPEDMALLDSAPERVRALAYDVVYNGTELGGGSIRIHDPRVQANAFRLLGIDDESARLRFGFLLEALESGAPPHGGIALGFDRIAMMLAGASSLRDVIAFPKTTAARALFENAPGPVPPEDLDDLHLQLRPGK